MNQFKIKKGLIVNGDGGTILDVQGSNGELFSVNDNFSGILFSVNNISGLPIMTVSSDNSIVMGQFGLNVLTLTGNSVGIGTASPTANLHVVGNARVTGAILDSTNAPGTSGQVLTSTVTGTDWKSLAEISGVDGTGTANYLSKWADADTITNSIVYDNGTNVTIGGNNSFGWKTFINSGSNGSNLLLGSSTNGVSLAFNDATCTIAPRITGVVNHLQFSTNSAERMRITSGGNVGIGTTAPGALLDVNGSLGSGKSIIRVTNSDTANYITVGAGIPGISNAGMNFTLDGTSKMVLSAGGNVGIGTTSPSQKLDVNGYARATSGFVGNSGLSLFGDNSSTNRVFITTGGDVGIGTTSPSAQLEIRNNQTGDGIGGATLRLTRGDSTSVAGDPVGTIEFYSTDADTPKVTAYIKSMSEELYGRKGSLAFGVSQTINTDATEAMRISDAGNVGIGTTAPTSKLQISDAASPIITLERVDATVTDNELIGRINFKSTDTNDTNPNAYISAIREVSAVSQVPMALTFGTGVLGTVNERLRITSTGNVGIGTTAPGTKLQVAGTIRATGTSGIVDVDPLYGAFRFYNGSTFYGGFYNDAVLSAGNAVDLVSYVATGDYYIGSATTAKAVKVEQGGNVGIGTTSPTEKLDVNGVVNANSFSAGGTAGFTGMVVIATNPPGSQMLNFQGGLLVSVS